MLTSGVANDKRETAIDCDRFCSGEVGIVERRQVVGVRAGWSRQPRGHAVDRRSVGGVFVVGVTTLADQVLTSVKKRGVNS